jgi:hypothetical protein
MRLELLAEHVVPAIALWLGEEGAVPHRLDEQEDDVEQDGDGGEEKRWSRAVWV